MGQIAQSRGFDGDGNLVFGTGQVIPDDADLSGVEWEGAAPDEAPAPADDGKDWQVADRRVFDADGNLVAGVGDRYDAGQEGLVVEEVFVTGAGSPDAAPAPSDGPSLTLGGEQDSGGSTPNDQGIPPGGSGGAADGGAGDAGSGPSA